MATKTKRVAGLGTWDSSAAEKASVELDLGGGHTFRTYNQPEWK